MNYRQVGTSNNLFELTAVSCEKRVAGTAMNLLQTGKSALQSGSWRAARGLYKFALRHDPSLVEAWLCLGDWEFTYGSLTASLGHYYEAIRLDDRCWLAHLNLARIFEAQGLFDASARQYLKVLAINPRHGDAHYALAYNYQRAGKKRAALRHYRLYLTCPDGEPLFRRAALRNMLKLAPGSMPKLLVGTR